MISSGQVEFRHSTSVDGAETGATSLLCFAIKRRADSQDTREYVVLPVFTKLHAKAQVTC